MVCRLKDSIILKKPNCVLIKFLFSLISLPFTLRKLLLKGSREWGFADFYSLYQYCSNRYNSMHFLLFPLYSVVGIKIWAKAFAQGEESWKLWFLLKWEKLHYFTRTVYERTISYKKAVVFFEKIRVLYRFHIKRETSSASFSLALPLALWRAGESGRKCKARERAREKELEVPKDEGSQCENGIMGNWKFCAVCCFLEKLSFL